MTQDCQTPFGTYAPIYRKLGFWPRPAFYGVDPRSGEKMGKACKEMGWQTPDPDLPPARLADWDRNYPQFNIGLLTGSPFGDGTFLGAFDNDDDRYNRLSRTLLQDPPCGRVGKKGIVYFVRYRTFKKMPKLKYKVNSAHIAEWFFRKSQVIIPPSIHPETDQPYRWEGIPLHEIDFRQLPIIEV